MIQRLPKHRIIAAVSFVVVMVALFVWRFIDATAGSIAFLVLYIATTSVILGIELRKPPRRLDISETIAVVMFLLFALNEIDELTGGQTVGISFSLAGVLVAAMFWQLRIRRNEST